MNLENLVLEGQKLYLGKAFMLLSCFFPVFVSSSVLNVRVFFPFIFAFFFSPLKTS